VRLEKTFNFFCGFLCYPYSVTRYGRTDVQPGEDVSPVLYRQLFRTPVRYIFRDIYVRDFQCKTWIGGENILLSVVKTLQHKELIRVGKAEN
jgi:hypothetical protein